MDGNKRETGGGPGAAGICTLADGICTLAVITARGKSKRIPHKNAKEFCGKPILAYSVEAAKAAGIFDEIMVSTDDAGIAEIGRQYGADVPFLRSDRTSDDFATTADVLREVLGEYGKKGKTFTHICCIYPTAPFVTGEKLKEAMELLMEKKADCVMPVVKFSFPPQRSVVVKEGKLQAKWEEYMNCRSQDLEPFYHDCGQFYCMDAGRFLETGKIIMENTLPVFTEEMAVQDIDTVQDWQIAELKYRILQEQKEIQTDGKHYGAEENGIS